MSLRNTDPASRYHGVPTHIVDGVLELNVRERGTPSTYRFQRYTFKESDRLDLLADRFFQKSSAWWRLADANDSTYPKPAPGTRVRVPQ